MKKKSITLIVGLMTLALLGVMGMQLYFFRQSYQLQSRLFDQAVHDALSNVVERIGKRDANNFLEKKVETLELIPVPVKQKVKEIVPQFITEAKKRAVELHRRRTRDSNYLIAEQRKADSIFMLRDSIYRARYPDMLVMDDAVTPEDLNHPRFNLDILAVEDAYGRIQTKRTISRALQSGTSTAVSVNGNVVNARRDSVRQYVINDPVEGVILRTIPKPRIVHVPRPEPEIRPVDRVEKVKKFLAAEDKKADVFKDLAKEYTQVNVPIHQRIHPLLLDSMLRYELTNLSINSDFEYKVTSAKRDSLIFRRASNQTLFLPANSYQIPLFPKDIIVDSGLLTITFPDKNNIILSNLTAMMGISGGLLLILLFCFGYTIHSILRQKKISEMKTDFINNMTHEFKTPVATIMIASEALKDPELTSDKSRIDRLAGIIYDENVRLGNHIERVLNIAKIDKGDLRLENKEVEMNDLLTAIADSMSLQLQKRNAKIELQLNATHATVNGDELHLSNVIFNLLDNANKYSPKDPEITLRSYNTGKNLVISVADKGIGMNRDQLSKIFEQFYRIPTGNLHDVKGFGLGLSYVNNIVKRLHGTVRVKSEKDKGSEFEISLPLA